MKHILSALLLSVLLSVGAFAQGTGGVIRSADASGNGLVLDPCQSVAKTYVNISLTANTKLITGTASKKIYICSLNLVAAAATNIAIVEGTGSTCATNTIAFPGTSGGATAATGWNFAANGGLTFGNGMAAVAGAGVAADDLCLFVSAANQISGGFSYVVQ